MQDPFQRARAIHEKMKMQATAGMPAQAPASPHMPQMPTMAQEHGKQFEHLSKQFGITGLKLDSNPVIARTQLMAHLQNKMGPDYMSQPGVKDLFDSFQGQSAQSARHQQQQIGTPAAKTMKALIGG